MGPAHALLNKVLQKERGIDGAAFAWAHMANVGHFAFEAFDIGLPQGQGPVFLAARSASSADALGKVCIVAKQARHLCTKGNSTGPGERGYIHHRSRNPVFLGIDQSIAQGKAAFRIGVLNFNRVAVGSTHHVAGAHGAAIGHVFGAGHKADDTPGCVFLRQSRNSGQHRGSAGHVALHLVHVGGGLDADAARVKGNALAHQNQGFILLVALGGVLKHDKPGRTARALAYGHKAAHAFLFQLGFVQHGAGKAFFTRQFLRLLGQHFGVEQVGRGGCQITRKAHGPSGIFAPAGGGVGGVGHFLPVKGHGQPLRVGRFVGIGLFKGRKAVQGKLGGAHTFFNQPFAPTGQFCQGRFGQHQGGVALLAAQLHGGGNTLADDICGDFFTRAKAHGQHAGHGKVGVTMYQGEFALFALEVAHGRGYDQPGGNLVQFRNLFEQGLAFTCGGEQDVSLPVFRAKILKAYIHELRSPRAD